MIQVGITGGIGSGKSLVSKVFKTLGYLVYDADAAAKNCYVENETLKQQVIALFGEQSYTPEGDLNRVYLSEQVFGHADQLKALNALVHPVVAAHYQAWLAKHSSEKIVFKEAAILMETGNYQQMDFNILVTAPEEMRIARVMKRDQSTKEEVMSRINKQWPDAKKAPLADLVLANDGTQPLLSSLIALPQQLLLKF